MNLMDAVGGISDRHIEEFAYISPKKRRIEPWIKTASAACLVLVVAVIAIVSYQKFIPDNYGNSPCVYFNDRVYSYRGRPYTQEELSQMPGYPDILVFEDGYYELPEGYVEVGEITSNSYKDENINGFGAGPKVGEKIYQDPEHPEDLYVYTKLFSNVKYRYIQFVDKTYKRVRINGKTYVLSPGSVDLPDGYVQIGEVTTIDRKDRYVDGFGQGLEIGAKIYGSPENLDVLYVYTNYWDHTYGYYFRFVPYEE
ncbi:MAG: hypothetical protein J1F04_06080 [Oscillospiraceae bacterium]|nr:hypothetical protein [Oscillospiraceae bacterium]